MAKSILFKLLIQGPDLEREITLRPGITSLGREPGNDIALAFAKISRRHAHFECSETMCLIIDLESANGTIVDGVRIQAHVPTPLNDNARIEIDPVKIICQHTIIDLPDDTGEKPPEQRTIARKQVQPETPKEDVTSVLASPPQPKPEKATEEPIKEVPKAKKPPAPPDEPPKQKPPSPTVVPEPQPEAESIFPPGLSDHSIRYIDYLPGIYQDEFMSHFLALFESILFPIEWNVDNFDLFLSPGTAPLGFLPWLSSWYDLAFDASWSEEQRRRLLREAHQIYARRGTRWALNRLLEIYTGQTAEIVEFEKDMEAHVFKVILKEEPALDKNLVMRLIDANKPAHASYKLEFRK